MKILILVLSLATIIGAQEAPHTARILYLNGPQSDTGPYFLFDGAETHEVNLPRLSLSPVYDLRPGDLKLWLLRKPVADVESLPEGAPTVLVPAGVRDFYLICTTDNANKVVPIQMRLVNANTEKIGRGEMLWFNLTKKPLAGTVGSRTLRLEPGATSLVQEPVTGNKEYPIELYFRVEGDDRTHPLIESQWSHDPRTRSIVFVFDEGKRRAPRVMAFSDFRMPKEKE
jgi:hypothetical protein